MSNFATNFGPVFDRLNETFGETVTFTHLITGTAETLTAIVVEDVGANDPFAERTFYFNSSDFAESPTNGDVITANSLPWSVQKVRENEDATYEIRCRAPEESI